MELHAVRRYRDRPARVVEHCRFQVNYTLDTERSQSEDDTTLMGGLMETLT